ncbi:MAG: Holliday junction branch migration protein RuvA [Deltaproteobacteria bacterium]|nr:Holliday junction branch migration protein RuvA [Deltaproteobacteria bacterium]
MIGYISGKILGRWDWGIIVDVNGIGYEIQMPPSSLTNLSSSDNEVTIFTHLAWKDDTLSLYGFESIEARDMFRLLLEVSGVGTRLALNILSMLSAEELLQILAREENKRLQAIHGVGEKTAARLCIDLKEKAKAILTKRKWDVESAPHIEQVAMGDLWDDALSALAHLGYSPSETKAALAKAFASAGESANLEDLVKKALQGLAKSRTKQA